MVQLEKYCKLVLTDSGGVQKEAFFHERPCVTVRDETEWTELVDAGWNRLAPPTSVDDILAAIAIALTHQPTPTRPYGDGSAADKIAESLAE
ncbi:UDP-2,3-diacetamido-2,3-dideoxy-D-glucuronate 2-epimerase [compost metagenome]